MLEIIKDIIETTVEMWSEFFYWIGEYHLYFPFELISYVIFPRKYPWHSGGFMIGWCFVMFVGFLFLFCVVDFFKTNSLKPFAIGIGIYWLVSFPLLLYMAIWAIGTYFIAILVSVLLCYVLIFRYV